MSDNFTFDDFDDEPLGGEPPKPQPVKPVRPMPTAAAAKAVPTAPAKSFPEPKLTPPPMDFSSEPDDYFDESPVVAKGKKPALKGGGERRKPLLLLLLLLVAGGGAYYYLYGIPGLTPPPQAPTPQPARPVAAVAKPQPAPTAPAATATQALPAKPAQPAVNSPQPVPASPAAAPTPAATAATQAVPAKPVQTATQSQPAPAKPVQAATTQTQSLPAKPAPAQVATPVAAVKPQAPAPAPSAHGLFCLTAGPFIYRGNVQTAESKLRGLGYESQVVTVKRATEMIRLRIGSFPPQEAEERRNQLLQHYPGAFVVVKGDQWVVYAGSFHEVGEARKLADKLYQDGYRVEEEKAQVKVPMKLVRFGDFPDRAAAEQAAEQVRAAGVPVEIAKR